MQAFKCKNNTETVKFTFLYGRDTNILFADQKFLYRNEREGMCCIYENEFGSIFTQLGFLPLNCEGIKSIICYCKYIEVAYMFNQ